MSETKKYNPEKAGTLFDVLREAGDFSQFKTVDDAVKHLYGPSGKIISQSKDGKTIVVESDTRYDKITLPDSLRIKKPAA